ncbi:MAG: sensor histidine kinase [Bacillota bacterium]
MDEGTIRWDIQPQSLVPLIEETIAKLSVQVASKELKIILRVDPETPEGLFDYDKLQQVLINLLANAIEFTPVGGEIRVTAAPAGDWIQVSVQDTGIGIPPEDLPRIFERFYRVDKARSRMLGGTGLGLAIAKQIIELMGGRITIASELGKGTEVTFTLPVAVTAEKR